MDFPHQLFDSVHKIINIKTHLHHSHTTGKIIGYVHDFYNAKVRENKDVLTCIAHNFFGFDMYFLIKGTRLSVWKTKDINIDRTGLTNINVASIDNIKFIDTMKYNQTSLGKLASMLTDIEKNRVEVLIKQFLMQHRYFSKIWLMLTEKQKNQVLKIIVSGKGVIPYKKIDAIDALQKEPEDGIFFSKEEFFSTLKGQAVNDDDYENSKKLFILLKMRNLSDLNDLYNTQDVILLLEIIENRFQEMKNKCGYNPRKVNSTSKLTGFIQREQSKVILALPTDNKQMETFAKTLLGGFSCINTRLPFDSEILMPNLTEKDFQKMNIDQSFKAYKRDDLKLIYKIKLDNQENYSKKRVIIKILNLDENNQCSFGMTKPMPTCCIKDKKSPSWLD